VGHEIVGTAVKVGKNVKHFKVGDRVGVGAQSGSCLDCEECAAGMEHYCSKGNVGTYNGKYPDGSKSYGGYGDYVGVAFYFGCLNILRRQYSTCGITFGIEEFANSPF
jgi:alcohol dehydrogenase (NADP+)